VGNIGKEAQEIEVLPTEQEHPAPAERESGPAEPAPPAGQSPGGQPPATQPAASPEPAAPAPSVASVGGPPSPGHGMAPGNGRVSSPPPGMLG